MRKTENEKIDKAYARVAEKHPDITNRRHLELLTRIYIMRQKKLVSGAFFLCGTVLTLLVSSLLPPGENTAPLLSLIASLLQIAGSVLCIIGVCKFAKALHDPLTPNESRELAAFDAIEKGGKTDIDISEFDNSAYIRYEQEKYNEASSFRKLLILAKRIPTLVWLFIIVLTALGIFFSVSGAHNMMTYAQRNQNAVTVQGVVVDVDESYNADADGTTYKHTYEYTYNGKTYTTSVTASDKAEEGSTQDFLIDSKDPAVIIHNNGKSNLIAGVIVLSVGIFILVYSLRSVRDVENSFSLFSLFWLPFAAAAIAFAGWGISLLIHGDWSGLLVLLIGCPGFLIGMFLFRMIFNSRE